MKSQKILNDPVYGFITIPSELIFTIIDHPYFQRLRRIKQLGLTDFVYPGALHTRFHHALGAMHLMSITLDNLRNKGTEISDPEYEAALIAILLHDIGHGPFSHALEYSLLKSVPHEELSLLIIELLNQELSGKLDLTLRIFKNQYERKFFHQLVSSQLDIDRLDYLQRDCFFTGVSEGTIGADRIIKMMDVKDDQVVIEEKGIYSIENFLSARRLMYWQVYLHKTTVSAEKMLINLIQRAKDLKIRGANFPISEEFDYLLGNEHTLQDFQSNPDLLKIFLELDDLDLWGAIKLWKKSDDYVLRSISRMFLTRNLFKISLKNDPFTKKEIESSKRKAIQKLGIPEEDLDYFFSHGTVSNYGYLIKDRINILTKKGKVIDVAQAADLPNIKVMSKIVEKHYICKAKSLI
ncbi:MAG TPA: phosphohydrolase [Algoriphagus sp.]|uniref:HD domain-containing protein n=1 Tax=unclassified Algoriphagus TaxID=2641541 RepID=UPI000C41AFD2|nr:MULTISPECIES: HD domain-containing protein [unclassified Algoriphagus]MAL15147.1 phosphohydrolase [Algoriphagus sp.]QYH37776.1 HD domain-containing protein [Algoriphagus sp. NBT04N3]HAS57251.1 phosphohydrolase [Algoriphagus sp.]HCD88628.1 phosphohydrolase [Algoriphagus sp.]HCH42960.1 phosphohydrolase [Algoriphagus sp.]